MTKPSIAEVTRQLVARGSPFEMEEVHIDGRPVRTWKHAPKTMRAILERAWTFRERTYLVYEDERLTYEEALSRVGRLSRAMRAELGVRKGDRVAIAMRNYPDWPIAFWAAASAGAIVVPLNAWWQTGELEYALEDSGTKLLIADAERLEQLAGTAARLGIDTVGVRAPSGAARHDLGALAKDHRHAAELVDVEVAPDDDATLFYTSGTTGHPKGALGTHRNLCTNVISRGVSRARAALRRGEPIPEPPSDQKTTLVSVPLFHVTGCHSLLATNTWAGGKLVLMRKWDPERALELIEREGVNAFGGVPSMAWQVLESRDLGRRDTGSVEAVVYGGAPAPPELVRRIKQAFPGAQPGNGYGLTEGSAITCTNSAEDYVERPDSVGPPVPVCDVRVIDDAGNTLRSGGVGELCIRGPNIVRGYWQKPEATAATFRDGWLHTGDIARLDEDGFVYILDRAKDMLIRGGENIYCVEVEDALYHHPDVMDAAVIGRPHPVLGEEPEAVVQVVVGATADEATLRAWVRERLAAFKVPVRIHVRTEPLPRNANGKILKPALKRELGYLSP